MLSQVAINLFLTFIYHRVFIKCKKKKKSSALILEKKIWRNFFLFKLANSKQANRLIHAIQNFIFCLFHIFIKLSNLYIHDLSTKTNYHNQIYWLDSSKLVQKTTLLTSTIEPIYICEKELKNMIIYNKSDQTCDHKEKYILSNCAHLN